METNKKEYQITKVIFISIFLTMFAEIVDVIFNLHISYIGITIFFVGIMYCEFKYKKISKKSIFVWIFVVIESCMIVLLNKSMIPILYPILLNFLIFIYVFQYFDLSFYNKNNKKIRLLMFIYLIINITLFLTQNILFIQNDGFNRFKGVLPHANMLSALLFCLLFLNSIIKDNYKLLLDLLILILIFLAASRLYIVTGIAVYLLINYFENIKGNKYRIINKLVLCKYIKDSKLFLSKYRKSSILVLSILGLVLIIILLYHKNYLYNYIINTDTYKRIYYLKLSTNGRDLLTNNSMFIFNKSIYFDKIFGGNMSYKYDILTRDGFSHSFGENSVLTVNMAFGIVGLTFYFSIFIVYIVSILDNIKANYIKVINNIIIIIIVALTTYFQDIILSTQLFLLYCLSLSIIKSDSLLKNQRGE